MRFVVAGFAGALTSIAMLIAALRFYVGFPNPYPYVVWAAVFCALELVFMLLRNGRGGKTSLRAKALTYSLDAIVFAVGAAAGLHGLLAIYPPNMS